MSLFKRIRIRSKYYRKKYFAMFLLSVLATFVFLSSDYIEKWINKKTDSLRKTFGGSVIVQLEGNQEGLAIANSWISGETIKKFKQLPDVTDVICENETGVRGRNISNVNDMYLSDEVEEFDFIVSGITDFSVFDKEKVSTYEIAKGKLDNSAKYSAAISQLLAEQNNIDLGDWIYLESDSTDVKLKVTAIYRINQLESVMPIYANPINRIFTTSDIVNELESNEQYSRCEIILNDPEKVNKIATNLKRTMFEDDKKVEVKGVAIKYKENRQMLDYIGVLVKLVKVFWGVFTVFIYILLIEQYYSGKKTETIILKSLGEKKSIIGLQFCLELVFPGLSGIIVGYIVVMIGKMMF